MNTENNKVAAERSSSKLQPVEKSRHKIYETVDEPARTGFMSLELISNDVNLAAMM